MGFEEKELADMKGSALGYLIDGREMSAMIPLGAEVPTIRISVV
jgi:hypothetical protein